MEIYLHKGGHQIGPLSLEEVNAKVRNGECILSEPAWIEGWTEWQTLSCIPGFVPRAIPPPFTPPVPRPSAPPPVERIQESQGYPTITTPSSPNADAMFLYIPIGRLIAMSVVSFGLYDAYWIYRNWRYLKERDGLKIQPFWRGIFAIFFIHSLFKTISTDPTTNTIVPAKFSPRLLATGWIILMLLGRAFERAEDIVVNLIGLIISAPTFCFLLPAQRHINALNEASFPRPKYHRFSVGHILCLIFGIILWPCLLVGLLKDISSPAMSEPPSMSQSSRAPEPVRTNTAVSDAEFAAKRKQARSDAVALYPCLDDKTSALTKEANRLVDQYNASADPIAQDPNAPMLIAAMAAKNLSITICADLN